MFMNSLASAPRNPTDLTAKDTLNHPTSFSFSQLYTYMVLHALKVIKLLASALLLEQVLPAILVGYGGDVGQVSLVTRSHF